MRRFTAFAIVGLFVAAAPAFAQQAGTSSGGQVERREFRIYRPDGVQGCGFLGIFPTDLSSRTATKLGLAERRGAYVTGVVGESGASRAGILEKDVITALNGEPIRNEHQLRRLIVAQTPGTYVRLDILRGGQTVTVNAEITSLARYGGPDCNSPQQREEIERRRDAVRDMDLGSVELRRFEDELRNAETELDNARRQLRSSVTEVRVQRNMANGYEGTTGMGLQRMSPQLAEYFRTGTAGALVNEVAEGSPALRAGMQAGDVIVEVNGAEVKGPMDAVKAIVDDRDGTVDLLIVREGERRAIQIRTTTEGSAPRQAPSLAPNGSPDIGTRYEQAAPPMRLAGGIEDLR